jgi:hypothetical protein
MEPFSERAEQMGLDITNAFKGMYSYQDSFGEVVYRQLTTGRSYIQPPREPDHGTDAIELPYLAVFVKPPEQEDYNYSGYVSNMYKFVGNEALTGPVKESILSTGTPIVREASLFSDAFARLRHEIIIQSSVTAPSVGDILPVMIISNSYNGTRAATLAFGLATMHERVNYVTFAFHLGEMRMVHIESSNTTMTSAVSEYVETFRFHIADMIQESLNKRLSEEEMLATLDLVEGIGKRRREIISESLPSTVTAWGMFLSIVKYSSFEANLNVKRMLENIAESVLVIPARMYDVLNRLENQ